LQCALTFSYLSVKVNKEFQGASIFSSSSIAPEPDVEKGGHGHVDAHGTHGNHGEGGNTSSLKHRIMSMRNMPMSDKTAAHIAAINNAKKHPNVHHSIAPAPLEFVYENEMSKDTDSSKDDVTREPDLVLESPSRARTLTLDIPDHRRPSLSSVIHSPRAAEMLKEHAAVIENAKWWHRIPCCQPKGQSDRSSALPRDDFSDIYIFNEPLYYFRWVIEFIFDSIGFYFIW
jgi:hypothetical protein